MASLVTNLQKDILNSEKSVTEILRTAKLISAKLGLSDIQNWIGAELNGYSERDTVPSYRSGPAVFQSGSLSEGWGIVRRANTRMSFVHSMPQIEDFSRQNQVAFQPETNIPILFEFDEAATGSPEQKKVVVSGTVFKGIIEVVRDRLLDWSIELEKRGITGENMSFDNEEKQKAHNQTFNIQHFTGVLGDVKHSNVNVYNYRSIHQLLKQQNVPQKERNKLKNILNELKNSPPEKKPSLIEKGKAWIVKNQEFLGAGASIVRQALGIPDVA